MFVCTICNLCAIGRGHGIHPARLCGMKALVITSLSGPDALAIQDDLLNLLLKPGQTLVRVAAGGLNFADFMTTQGGYPGTPAPPLIAGPRIRWGRKRVADAA